MPEELRARAITARIGCLMLAGIVMQPLGVKQEVCFATAREVLPLLGFRYVGVVVRKGIRLRFKREMLFATAAEAEDLA